MKTQAKFESRSTFTIPLNKRQEIEVIFRLREKGRKELDWGQELLRIFEPVRSRAGRYSLKEVEADIAKAVKAVGIGLAAGYS